MNSHVCEVGEYMDERYGQVTCDVARDESSPSQHWRVHRQYPAHVATPSAVQIEPDSSKHWNNSIQRAQTTSRPLRWRAVTNDIGSFSLFGSLFRWDQRLRPNGLKSNANELVLFQLTNDLCTSIPKIIIISLLDKAVFIKKTLLFLF